MILGLVKHKTKQVSHLQLYRDEELALKLNYNLSQYAFGENQDTYYLRVNAPKVIPPSPLNSKYKAWTPSGRSTSTVVSFHTFA